MDKQRDLTKHYEAILGTKLPFDPGVITLREEIGTYSVSGGSIVSRSLVFNGPPEKRCGPTQLLDVAGAGFTGAQAKVEFRLSSFHCERGAVLHPVNFLCTPLSDTPVFLTASRAIIAGDPADLQITVRSWDPDGAPAPNTFFDWRCRLPFVSIL
jgi:hypothetical protein